MWVADSQTRAKPLKTSPNHPENRLFRPEFYLSFSQISQKPWGGWVGRSSLSLNVVGLLEYQLFPTTHLCKWKSLTETDEDVVIAFQNAGPLFRMCKEVEAHPGPLLPVVRRNTLLGAGSAIRCFTSRDQNRLSCSLQKVTPRPQPRKR